MERRRPSHKNEIKDSIHWEHYLEFSRRLESLPGTLHDRLFVSANKADFWANRETPVLHPDLETEALEASLQFFGRLDHALRFAGHLGIFHRPCFSDSMRFPRTVATSAKWDRRGRARPRCSEIRCWFPTFAS